jgi:hypothetical protein
MTLASNVVMSYTVIRQYAENTYLKHIHSLVKTKLGELAQKKEKFVQSTVCTFIPILQGGSFKLLRK